MLRRSDFIIAFESSLDDIGYKFLEPMKKSGGWAEIFYVYSKENKEIRVAKVYEKPLGRTTENIYKSDAEKLMKIQHENVVRIFDKGIIEYEEEKYFFLILEYVKGKDLEEIDSRLFLERPYNERLNYFVQTLEGINEFRKDFNLHYDLHPGNIMLSEEDKNKIRTIKIIDPGSSRYFYEPVDDDIDLYSIKEGILNLFFKPEEIKKINERKIIADLGFPEFKELINILNIEEQKKLRSKHLDNEVIAEKINLIFENRFNELRNGNFYINIPDPTRLLIHMISIDALEANKSFNLEEVYTDFESYLHPIGCSLGKKIERNLEGLLVSCGPDPHYDTYVGYVQLYRNGMIEAINSSLLKPTKILHGRKYYTPVKKLGLWLLEKHIIDSCEKYLKTLEKIEVDLPIFLYISFTQMRDYKISLVPYEPSFISRDSETCKIDDILLPTIKIDNFNIDFNKELKKSFNIFWNVFNQPRSRNFNENGQFIDDLFKK